MTTIDTGTEDLLARKENGVGYLVMNRPEARNAMSQEMNKAMQDTIAAFELDNEVRCIVLTGAGKGFCAGGDVKGMASRGDGTVGDNTIDAAIHKQRDHQRGTSGKLFKMPKPTIASLSGAAAGAGLSYALSCDLRIMSSEAFMTTAFAKVGFSGDYFVHPIPDSVWEELGSDEDKAYEVMEAHLDRELEKASAFIRGGV